MKRDLTSLYTSASTGKEYILHADHVSKRFGPTVAVDNVSFEIRPGEIVGLVGGNGAGKSTLMKILSGVLHPDEGNLTLLGKTTRWENFDPRVAKKYGVRVVTQELSLCSNLTVKETSFIEYRSSSLRNVRNSLTPTIEFLESIFPESGVVENSVIETLTLAQQQMVEIARAVADPHLSLLILDEPTSSLPQNRVGQLSAFLKTLPGKNIGVIYISHKLPEVTDLSSRIIAMRNGTVVSDTKADETSTPTLIQLMGGVNANEHDPLDKTPSNSQKDNWLLKLNHFSSGNLKDISLTVQPNEIVGVAGLEGNGQAELLKALYSNRSFSEESFELRGRASFVSGNRARFGIFAYWSMAKNVTIASLNKISKYGILSTRLENELSKKWFDKLNFRADSIDSKITSLSGGNQQKALIARALATDADIILLDDPTRGVDIGTKFEIYKLLKEWVASGHAVVWFSSEDEEMVQCDRVLILQEGSIADELSGTITTDKIVSSQFATSRHPRELSDTRSLQRKSTKTMPSKVQNNLLKVVLNARWNLALLFLVLMEIMIGIANPASVSTFGMDLLIGSAIPLLLAAVSQMFIINSGGIDLGLGAFVGLTNVITATLLINHPIVAIGAFAFLIILYGLMGALIYLTRVPSIVITLGASFIWLGIALMIQPVPGGSAPQWLSDFWNINLPIIPLPFFLTFAVGGATYLFLFRTRIGIVLRGFGNSASIISQSGWSGLKLQALTYSCAGVFAVLAGVAVTAVDGSADANSTLSFTLLSIAAVIIGGSEFIGGIIVPGGVVLGSLVLSLIESLLAFFSIGSNYQSMIEGLLLLLVLSGRSIANRRTR